MSKTGIEGVVISLLILAVCLWVFWPQSATSATGNGWPKWLGADPNDYRLNQGLQREPNTLPQKIVGWVCDPNAKPVYGILLQVDRKLYLHEPNCLPDETIRCLAASGRICEVMGHPWRGTGEKVEHPTTVMQRAICPLCGKTGQIAVVRPEEWLLKELTAGRPE